MKVGIYAIALNESQFVQRWYESAKDADYLLIADTGSSDDTVKIAKSLGINVVEISVKPWRFDIARNAALSLLPSDLDYCIALDMDEVLLDGWKEKLYKSFEHKITRPRYRYTWSWKDEVKKIPGLQYSGDKIHARFGYRWKHPVHEVITPDIITETHMWTGLEIHHYPDHSKPRSQYFPLLELAVKEDPRDSRNSYYYARELFFYQKYNEARDEFLRYLSLPDSNWSPERSSAMRYIAKTLLEDGEKEMWLKKAAKESPDRREPIVDLGEFYYKKEEWKKCLLTLEKAFKIKEKSLEFLCEEFAWSDFPYDMAAISAYKLNNKAKAKMYNDIAISISPDNKRLIENAKFYA